MRASEFHVAAMWLLIVSVLLGPAGLAGSASFARSLECGACPCDEETADQDEDECSGDSATHQEHSSDDECPPECPDCHCYIHAAQAVLAASTRLTAAVQPSDTRTSMAAAPPGSGVLDGVFRPPRSLA